MNKPFSNLLLLLGASLLVPAPRAVAQIAPPFNVTTSAAILDADDTVLAGTNPASAPCDGVTPEPGCLVQIIGVGANNVPDLPNAGGSVSGDDSVLLTTYIGLGMNPCVQNPGRFTDLMTLADGTKIYCRAFNAPTVAAATHWGQSAVFTVSVPTVFDASKLGLKATWMRKGVNPNTVDTDGDGESDYNELVANTNPLNPSDRAAISEIHSASSVSIAARAGRKYTLQRSTDDPGGPMTWTDVATTGVLNSDADMMLNDPTPPATPQVFYRVKISMQ